MSAGSLSAIWAAGVDVLKSTVNAVTKTVLFQTGDVLAEKADGDNVEHWQHVGLVSRPPKPSAGKAAAQCVVLRGGDRDVSIASRDLRGQALAGNIQDGETCLYAAGTTGTAQPRLLMKANGTISLFTRDGNSEGGQAVALQLNPDSSFAIVSKYGAIRIDATGITISSGKAALILGADGSAKLHANGLCEVAGKITCVGTNCLPAPTNTAFKGPSGVLGTPSLSVYIGT